MAQTGTPIARVKDLEGFKRRLNNYLTAITRFMHSYEEDVHYVTALLQHASAQYTAGDNWTKEGGPVKSFIKCVHQSFKQTAASPTSTTPAPPVEGNIYRLLNVEHTKVQLTPFKAMLWFIFRGSYQGDTTQALVDLGLVDIDIPDVGPLADVRVTCSADIEHHTMQEDIIRQYAAMLRGVDNVRINVTQSPSADRVPVSKTSSLMGKSRNRAPHEEHTPIVYF